MAEASSPWRDKFGSKLVLKNLEGKNLADKHKHKKGEMENFPALKNEVARVAGILGLFDQGVF